MEDLPNVCSSSTTLCSTHPSSHHKPTPRRRNEHMPWLRHRPIQTTHLLFLIFLTCCLSLSSATVYIEEQMVETQDDGSEFWESGSDLAGLGPLLADPAWTPERLAALHETSGDLRPRNVKNATTATTTSSTLPSSTLTSSTSTMSGSASTTATSATAVTPLPTNQLPVPFDIGFSNNITSSCQSFMTSMLTNSTFKSCLPFSLLLQVCLSIVTPLSRTISNRTAHRIPIPSSKRRNLSPA